MRPSVSGCQRMNWTHTISCFVTLVALKKFTISFASHDQDSGICNTMQRFVAAADSDRVQALLLGRISRESKRNGDFALELEVGHAVVNSGSADLGTLGQPLDATL